MYSSTINRGNRGLALRIVAAALIAVALACAQDPASLPTSDGTIRVGVKYIVVPAVVKKKNGEYMNGLRAEDFRLLDNDKPQKINVDVSYAPISLVVAIQASSASEPVLPRVKQIGSLLTAELAGAQGRVAVLDFDHRVTTLQDFTSDTNKIEASLQKLKAGSSSSAMLDAVEAGARMLRHEQADRRKVLLLISEPRDAGSTVRLKQVLTDLEFDNITVYSININRVLSTLMAKNDQRPVHDLPPGAQPMPAGFPAVPSYQEQAYGNPTNSANFAPAFVGIFKEVKGFMVGNPTKTISEFTGGDEFTFFRQPELEAAIQSIGEEVHSEYLITYNPNNKSEGGFHTIQVEVLNHSSADVRTRPGYWIAAQPGN